jgi:hypothetical protein
MTTGVVAVIVNSINLMMRAWTLPHIFQKTGEVLPPTLAHGYATTAVIAIVDVLGVFAARNYVIPDGVFRTLAQSMRMIALKHHFMMEATTAISMARTKIRYTNHRRIATSAPTKPLRLPSMILTSKAQYGQSAKDAARQILNFLIRYRHNLRHFLKIAIVGGCKEGQLWGRILHVDKLLSACDHARDVDASPGVSVRLLLDYYSTNGRIGEAT